MHRKILFGIIAAVVCGLFVSSPSAQAGGYVTSASRTQYYGYDIWKFYYDTSVSGSTIETPATYWMDQSNPTTASHNAGSSYFEVTIPTGSYSDGCIYVYGTNPYSSPQSDYVHRASYVTFYPNGTYSIYLEW